MTMPFQQQMVRVLFGADALLFLFGAFRALCLFSEKRNRIFGCVAAGLVCAMGEAAIAYTSFDPGTMVLIFSPLWVIMVQATTWLYVFRIRTLRVFPECDNWVRVTPWAILVGQIPVIVLFNLDTADPLLRTAMLAVGLTYDACVIAIEIALFLVVMKKLLFLLEYRPTFKRYFVYETAVMLTLIVLGDAARMTAFVLAITPLTLTLSASTYLFRLVVVIRTYEIVRNEIETLPHLVTRSL